MSVFKENCPHCGTKSVAFTIIGETLWSYDDRTDRVKWDALAKCGHCGRGIVAALDMDQGNPETPPSRYLHLCKLLSIFPSPPSTGAPPHTPENASRFFKQGMENLSGNYDAAGTMFRKALDTGLKNKFPEMTGTLNSRIDKAAKSGGLTSDLAEWAHEIRALGNDAAHEEEPFSKQDALNLRDFTFLVFQYLFMLPGMLEKAQRD